jgi:cyclopropane fatty-acyl-phospholipid synthase-like methyltransferase
MNTQTGPTWADIWAKRSLDKSRSKLAALMAADGLDTGFGNVGEAEWRDFVKRTAAHLELAETESIYEVGCGAGAFLLELAEAGHRVGGLDLSPALIQFAKEAIPGGQFTCAEAAAVDPAERWDAVVSCGVFLYFPDLAYAEKVIDAMAHKAKRAVAVLDIPDKVTERSALAHRRGSMGAEEYDKRYASLPHLYYDRAWIAEALRSKGFTRVEIENQKVNGYANAAYRFNAFAFR